ncbi:MAG: Smr/MutS family protein, partial [Bacteroidales bacterium]|nr:Smr/MutS family protein [Bacteroidales bacterium]
LTPWTEGSLQFLFHKEHVAYVLPPFDMDYQIDGKKFHKEGAYRETLLLNGKGIVIHLLSLTSYIEEYRAKSSAFTPPASGTKTTSGESDLPIIFSHQSEPRKAVVDLHIHELIEDPSNLQKPEILGFQKTYFIRCLDAAIANNFLDVIFIHGVGDGTLRGVLIDQLKKTEGIEWFDAPMANYGAGAIEVRIPHNR